MRKRSISKDDIVVRLRAHIEAGDTLRALIEHPAYSGFFNAMEAEYTQEMRNARLEDDAGRRNAAIKLNMLAIFRQHMSDVATRAKSARAKLETIEKAEGENNAG